MQVRDLIEELKRFDEIAEVVVEDAPECHFGRIIKRVYKQSNANQVVIEIDDEE